MDGRIQPLKESLDQLLTTDPDPMDLERERLEALDLQMPSFLRGDEEEDAEAIFHL